MVAMALPGQLMREKGGEKGRREWAAVGRKEGGGGNEPVRFFHFLIPLLFPSSNMHVFK
jgi:hypothetical protein